jgi:hypothetical protein
MSFSDIFSDIFRPKYKVILSPDPKNVNTLDDPRVYIRGRRIPSEGTKLLLIEDYKHDDKINGGRDIPRGEYVMKDHSTDIYIHWGQKKIVPKGFGIKSAAFHAVRNENPTMLTEANCKGSATKKRYELFMFPKTVDGTKPVCKVHMKGSAPKNIGNIIFLRGSGYGRDDEIKGSYDIPEGEYQVTDVGINISIPQKQKNDIPTGSEVGLRTVHAEMTNMY